MQHSFLHLVDDSSARHWLRMFYSKDAFPVSRRIVARFCALTEERCAHCPSPLYLCRLIADSDLHIGILRPPTHHRRIACYRVVSTKLSDSTGGGPIRQATSGLTCRILHGRKRRKKRRWGRMLVFGSWASLKVPTRPYASALSLSQCPTSPRHEDTT